MSYRCTLDKPRCPSFVLSGSYGWFSGQEPIATTTSQARVPLEREGGESTVGLDYM